MTHNHPEGIKGAQATATAVFLARQGESKTRIKAMVERVFGDDLLDDRLWSVVTRFEERYPMKPANVVTPWNP